MKKKLKDYTWDGWEARGISALLKADRARKKRKKAARKAAAARAALKEEVAALGALLDRMQGGSPAFVTKSASAPAPDPWGTPTWLRTPDWDPLHSDPWWREHARARQHAATKAAAACPFDPGSPDSAEREAAFRWKHGFPRPVPPARPHALPSTSMRPARRCRRRRPAQHGPSEQM